ncbi:MAG: T9SS type A sorting domain-containing protein [Bacteroidetes bacterium]|nr:T9SS type A sorting domain-containing protein [Bacteroidota bacterium]
MKFNSILLQFRAVLVLLILIFFPQLSYSGTGSELTGSFNLLSTQGGEDNISNKRFFSSNSNVRGIAAAIEQRGANAGRMWAIVVYSTDNNFPDTFNVYNSANNGLTWQNFIGGNIRPNDKMSYNDIDMEIIESTSGQKYLWVVFGYRQGGATGPLKTGGFIIQFPSVNGVFFNEMTWFGADSSKNFYDIHMTTDNARYPGTANVFLACSFDTLDGNGNRVYGQRLARCTNPYSLAVPNFQYTPGSVYWTDTSPASQRKTVYTDIAYFNNGGQDSLLLSFSGAKDSSKIYFSKIDKAGIAPGISAGAVSGLQSSDYKTHARLSSNGNDNGNIICSFRQFSGGNWNAKYFSSTNFGNFNSSFAESQLLGSNINPNYPPDIIGVRNGSSHYLSFITAATTDSLRYFSLNSQGIQSSVSKMNYYSSLGKEAGPRALFRYAANDSCMAFYTESGPVNLISAAGCTGSPIGILNQNGKLPSGFALGQNYPNPFNPNTVISYQLPYAGFVKLNIYDVNGKLIKELGNEKQGAGSYSINFSGEGLPSGVYYYSLIADGFVVDTKKAVLIK